MKKLIFVMAVLTAVAMISPTDSFANDLWAENQFGVFVDSTAIDNNFSVAASTPFFGYLVLLKPVDNYGVPVDFVEAFEFAVTFSNGAMVFKLAETLPPQSINVGDANSPANGLQYAVGMGVPAGVFGQKIPLIMFQFMVLTADPIDIFIVPSISGNIYYQEALHKELVFAFPSSSDAGLPVASFNGGVVATESSTWGSVKSLYR